MVEARYDGRDTETPPIRRTRDGLLVGFRVVPSAAEAVVRGVYGDRVKVAVNAPPEDGRANAALLQVLSAWLGVQRRSLSIESGLGSRDKVVAFRDIGEAELRSKLAVLLGRDRTAERD